MSAHSRSELTRLVEQLPTKSAKIRRLDEAGLPRADIARFLGIRYQHVRNVLVADEQKARRQEPEAKPGPVHVQIDEAGRVLVPAALRKWLGVQPGDRLIMEPGEGRLSLSTQAAALDRARTILKRYVPEGTSLADEIIADRRAEASEE